MQVRLLQYGIINRHCAVLKEWPDPESTQEPSKIPFSTQKQYIGMPNHAYFKFPSPGGDGLQQARI